MLFNGLGRHDAAVDAAWEAFQPDPIGEIARQSGVDAATVIERLTGVHYHAGHVWYILRGLHWSLQRPARQARERDERAIRHWIAERWPTVKKTPDASAPGSSS